MNNVEKVGILSAKITVSRDVAPCILVNGNHPQISKYSNHDNHRLDKFRSHMDTLYQTSR